MALETFDQVLKAASALNGVCGVCHGIGDVTTLDAFGVDGAIFHVFLPLILGILSLGDKAVTIVVGEILCG